MLRGQRLHMTRYVDVGAQLGIATGAWSGDRTPGVCNRQALVNSSGQAQCADMVTRTNVSAAATGRCASRLRVVIRRAASVRVSTTSRRANGKDCVQVHGGWGTRGRSIASLLSVGGCSLHSSARRLACERWATAELLLLCRSSPRRPPTRGVVTTRVVYERGRPRFTSAVELGAGGSDIGPAAPCRSRRRTASSRGSWSPPARRGAVEPQRNAPNFAVAGMGAVVDGEGPYAARCVGRCVCAATAFIGSTTNGMPELGAACETWWPDSRKRGADACRCAGDDRVSRRMVTSVWCRLLLSAVHRARGFFSTGRLQCHAQRSIERRPNRFLVR